MDYKMKKYIRRTNDGWMTVIMDGKREPVPEYLKVDLIENKGGRDHFTILEGVYKGKAASLAQGNLRSGSVHTNAVHLTFDLRKAELSYNSVKIHAFTDNANPIKKGEHPIQIPDFPHEGGKYYLDKSAYALNWFYLGVGHAVKGKNDRYLHPGAGSAGCITVDPDEWTKLYQYIILSRSGDGKNVGKVTVK